MAAVLPVDERDRNIPGLKPPATSPLDPLGAHTVEEQPDGGAVVRLTPDTPEQVDTGFDENLADKLPPGELDAISQDLIKRIDEDQKAREDRDKQYAEGLKRTGLGDDAPGGAQFDGASKVVHPMLAEAAVDFAANSMREIFPPNGPVRTKIIGEQTQEQLKIAERQAKYMNWQLTEQIEEYAEELYQTITQVPMGGSQYMKFWHDDAQGRITCQFVPVDDVLVPYGCNSFWAAHRITHIQHLTGSEWEDRVASGMYIKIEDSAPSQVPDQSEAKVATEKIEGVTPPQVNIDDLRDVYETSTFYKISIDGNERRPYLITIDKQTRKVCGVYRNWEEKDKKHARLHWLVDFNFIPWRGAIKLGLPQLIGGLSAAATGALRALLDSALVNSIPVLAKLKGAKIGGQAKTFNPLEAFEVEAGTGVEDIRRVMMALPFNAPSPVLYQIIEFLTNAAKGVVTTATEKIAQASPQMPMGTALALIEQDAKLFSSIHAGLHRSQAKALKIIARLNKSYLDENEQVEVFGEIICTKADFDRPLGVIPVSDPNIFSEGQRYAQMHLVQQTAVTYPQLHNLYEMVNRSYKLAKIPQPDIDAILPKPKQPQELNSAAENSAVMLGQPILAFPEQDHYSHLEAHMRFVMDPLLGGNPSAMQKTWPQMVEHVKQHLAFAYAKEIHDMVSQELGTELGEFVKDKNNWAKADMLIASASKAVHDTMTKKLQPLGQPIVQMVQQIAQMMPPPPMDPSAAALKVAGIEDARKREEGQRESQLDAATLDAKRTKDLADAAARAEELRIKDKDVDLRGGLGADKLAAEQQRAGLQRQADEARQRLEEFNAEQDRMREEADRDLQTQHAVLGHAVDAASQATEHAHAESLQANELEARRAEAAAAAAAAAKKPTGGDT